MVRGVNFSVLPHRAALIKIPLHSGGNIVTGFRRLSKTVGVSVSAEGSHGGTFSSVSGPLGVSEHGREEFSSTFKGIFISGPPVGLNGHPLTRRYAGHVFAGGAVCHVAGVGGSQRPPRPPERRPFCWVAENSLVRAAG